MIQLFQALLGVSDRSQMILQLQYRIQTVLVGAV
jgi:hypothetical protein